MVVMMVVLTLTLTASDTSAIFSPFRTGSRSNTDSSPRNDVDGSPSNWDRFVAGQEQQGGNG